MTSLQVGDNATDGVSVQTRWQLAKPLGNAKMLGLELYNSYGNSRELGSFNQQNHSIGPIYITPVGSGWSIFSSVLLGVSDNAPDTELKLWIRKNI